MAFTRSADVLVMLVIGGAAVLYGGFIGAAVFLLLRDLFPRSIRSTGTSGSGSCSC
jgi:ABC-type branched-subunit amino acid transport system permease subunit